MIACYFLAGLIALKSHTVLSSFERDGTEFLFDARRILDGQGYDSDYWPFGYMMVIAFIHFLTSIDLFTIGKLVTLISGVGVCTLTYMIGKRIFSENVGLLALIILATNHLFFLHSFLVETDMLFVFFFLLATYFLIKSNAWENFAAAGSSAGLAYMVKYGAYAFFPVILLLSLANIGENGLLDSFKKLAAFILAFLIVSSPWLAYNKIENGSAFYSKHYVNIAWGMNRPRPMPQQYWREYNKINETYSSMKDVVSDTKKFLRNWARNMTGLHRNIFRALSFMSLFVVPSFLIVFNALDRRKLTIIAISLSFLCLVTIAYTWDRYLLPIIPLLSILISYCLYAIVPAAFSLDHITKSLPFKVPFRIGVVSALIILSVIQTFSVANGFIRKKEVHEYERAGKWLKGNLTRDDWLMVPDPQVAWYAGTDKFVKYPADKSLLLEDAVKKRQQNTFVFIQEGLSEKIVTGIDYFIFDKTRWTSLISDDDPDIPGNFVPVFTTQGLKTRIVIYKIIRHRGTQWEWEGTPTVG